MNGSGCEVAIRLSDFEVKKIGGMCVFELPEAYSLGDINTISEISPVLPAYVEETPEGAVVHVPIFHMGEMRLKMTGRGRPVTIIKKGDKYYVVLPKEYCLEGEEKTDKLLTDVFCIDKEDGAECFDKSLKPLAMELINSVSDFIEGKGDDAFWTRAFINHDKLFGAFRGLMFKYMDDPEVVAFLGYLTWMLRNLDWIDIV